MRRGGDEPVEPRMVGALRAGDMRARVRDFDWAATPLGPRGGWPAALTWSVDLVLASGFPMAVRWGPDLVIYNDAYAALLGDKHPARARQAAARGLAGNPRRARPAQRSHSDRQERRVFSPSIIPGRCNATACRKRPISPSATARSPTRKRRTASAACWSRCSRPPSACATRKRCACSPTGSKPRSQAYPRARPHLDGVGGFARRLQFRRLLHQRQSGLEPSARLERGRDQSAACQRTAPSRRRAGGERRPRAPGARRADRAHGEPLPSHGRLAGAGSPGP